MERVNVQNWQLEYNGKKIPAQVPGDITIDLFNAGIIQNPYYGMNYVENTWVARTDFTYETKLNITEEIFNQPSIEIIFDGIDVYSDIYVNGKLIGSTENMFLQYRFDIKKYLTIGENTLNVCMRATLNIMDTLDTTGYVGVFNVKRLLVRKAQCHFGWDWAPKICAYGIWQNVYLEYGSKCKMDSVYAVPDDEGNITFVTELNYNIHASYEVDGSEVEGSYVKTENDTLHYYVSKTPFGDDYEKKSFPVSGKKNLACFSVKDAQLWWPVGYGDQPLYNYKVELERGGQIVDTQSGRIGFRTVKLVEQPKGDQFVGYEIHINGKLIFAKGANWVPIECFTGVVEDEKYDRLTDLAVQSNCNMLRVWGGGFYEKDVFFDLCDEKGILVWQDVMLACGDIPEDNPAWVSNILSEVEYQVKRLRNHASLVYWCGGNEKTGAYGRCITKGDFFVNVLLRGTILNLDRTRPYATQSPCSYTDVGNDIQSGECHYCHFESFLRRSLREYRQMVTKGRVPFISEAGFMGPNTVEANKRIYPEDKLWPMNELWNDRLMMNPYSPIPTTFAEKQMQYAGKYGEVKNLEDFTAKAMLMHAEGIHLEAEFARIGKELTSGWMTWMFSDIWPSGTWSVTDYWCEPKQAFYQMKRSLRPRLVTFAQNKEGITELCVVNDTCKPFATTIRFGLKTIQGETIWADSVDVNIDEEVFRKAVDVDNQRAGVYLFAEYEDEGEMVKTLYSPILWSEVAFESDYDVGVKKISEKEAQITIMAKVFAKSVFISFQDNYKYTFSDNYLDIEAGDSVTITVTADEAIDFDTMVITDFAEMTK